MSKSKAGRKGKYHKWLTEEGLTQIRGWAMDGLTQAEMAHNMGVGYSTFYEWQATADIMGGHQGDAACSVPGGGRAGPVPSPDQIQATLFKFT